MLLLSATLFVTIAVACVLVTLLPMSTHAATCSANATGGSINYFNTVGLSSCNASFDCLKSFCQCTNATFITSCIYAEMNASLLSGCLTERVHCTVEAALLSASVTEGTCAQWSAAVSAQYQAWQASNTANITEACISGLCNDVPSALKATTDVSGSCVDFTPATTAAPTATPPSTSAPIPVTPVATSVRVTFSGTLWATVLQNNRSSLTATVQSTISSALNVSASRVNVTSLSIGSLVVLFQLLGSANTASSNAALASSLSTSLNVANLNTFYQAAAGTNESISVSSTGVAASNGVVFGATSACGGGCVAGVVVGVILGVALVIGIVFVIRSKCAAPSKRDILPFEGGDEAMRCPTSSAANGEGFSRYQ
ncbi:membrane-associated protein, putative [Bodo saltans]|uniref:Membrane-associated protein, putative n=1 Tax=Bodo saltans TaxID=75058 RepID=A0A0S4IMP7_BODSA|nr:membrane-associated protein, putative [Bodo saltans]|eukprot:CUE67620.1 membrane-associated protein, putative [Bodo saltans]